MGDGRRGEVKSQMNLSAVKAEAGESDCLGCCDLNTNT